MDVNFFGTSLRALFGTNLNPRGGASSNSVVRPTNSLVPAVSHAHKHSFVAPDPQDGAMVFQHGSGADVTSVSFDNLYYTENQLINHYRRMALYPECDSAIDDVINGMLVAEEQKPIVSVRLDNVNASQEIKDKIREEFQRVLKLLKFRHRYYDLARSWYVDGRMYHHIMFDPNNPRAGIQEVRYIDPRHIRKVRGVEKVIDPKTKFPIVVSASEFYLFNPYAMMGANSLVGLPIAVDSISYCNSGMLNEDNTMIISHLHKAIKPLNMLKTMEDAVVIYRITRAPERRVFYVDVGNLPTNRAESFVRDLMARFRNRLVYNPSTGEIGDDRRYMAMQEDIWLPRREGGKGTQVDTLEGGQNLGKMEDVEYCLRQLYKSLNVPVSRLDQGASGLNFGKSSEITRDEIKFRTFTGRLCTKFSELFNSLMRVQLILKGITTEEGWADLREELGYQYISDSYLSELKDTEITLQRLEAADKADKFVGAYFSHTHVRKNILKQSDEEIAQIDREIDIEKTGGRFAVRAGEVVSGRPKARPYEQDEDDESDAQKNKASTKYSGDDSLPEMEKTKSSDKPAPQPKLKMVKGRSVRNGRVESASA